MDQSILHNTSDLTRKVNDLKKRLDSRQRKNSHDASIRYNSRQNLKPVTSEDVDDNLQLVPCRWAKSGWKYVQADPAKHSYFNSPNRVNSFGHSNAKDQL